MENIIDGSSNSAIMTEPIIYYITVSTVEALIILMNNTVSLDINLSSHEEITESNIEKC